MEKLFERIYREAKLKDGPKYSVESREDRIQAEWEEFLKENPDYNPPKRHTFGGIYPPTPWGAFQYIAHPSPTKAGDGGGRVLKPEIAIQRFSRAHGISEEEVINLYNSYKGI